MNAKNHAQTPRKASRGFTLVELLIVITIIAVLAGVGFPLMSRMRANTSRSQCLDRLRSWGVAMGGYAADHSGNVNWEHWPSIGWEEAKVSPYVHYWTGGSIDFEGHNDMGAYAEQLKQRCCPAVKFPKGASPPVTYSTIQPIGVAKVGITGRVEGKSSDYSLSKITAAGRFMLMIDTISATSGYSISTAAEFKSRVKPLTDQGSLQRHNGTVNALFADYSVQPMTWAQIEKGLGYWSTF